LRIKVADFVKQNARSREWVIGSPRFVDVVEDNRTRPEDFLTETLGGLLQIYSTFPPHKLPHDVDVANLHEVEALVDAVRKFSLDEGVNFDFELDRDFVGSVENGQPDEMLAEVLLGEWRRHLLG